MDEPPRVPDPFRWRNRGLHPRSDPREDQIGIGRKRPLLTFIAVWVLGLALIVGLSFVLPRHIEGIVAIVILLGLLSTARI